MKTRGFEICKGYEDTATLPKRGSKYSAGYDFYLAEDVTLPPKTTVLSKTGIKCYMQPDEVLEVFIRSSIGVKQKIRNSNCVCVIDSDYYNNEKNEGNIILGLYNYDTSEKLLKKGTRVCQGIFHKYLVADKDEVVNEKRTSGIGSTGI